MTWTLYFLKFHFLLQTFLEKYFKVSSNNWKNDTMHQLERVEKKYWEKCVSLVSFDDSWSSECLELHWADKSREAWPTTCFGSPNESSAAPLSKKNHQSVIIIKDPVRTWLLVLVAPCYITNHNFNKILATSQVRKLINLSLITVKTWLNSLESIYVNFSANFMDSKHANMTFEQRKSPTICLNCTDWKVHSFCKKLWYFAQCVLRFSLYFDQKVDMINEKRNHCADIFSNEKMILSTLLNNFLSTKRSICKRRSRKLQKYAFFRL